MPAPSLLEISRRLCIKNISSLEDVGDTPYPLIRPILLKIENSDQLRRIELASPQILGQDGEIWLNLIKSDIPGWEKRPHEAKDPTKWWKVYRKLQEDVAEERRQSEKKLQEALNKAQSAKEENRSTFIQKALDPGKTGRTTNLVRWNGDRSSLAIQDGRVVGTKAEPWGFARSGAASKPRMSALEKMRKQGKEGAAVSSRMTTPTHLLGNRTSRVTQVPKGMMTPPQQQPKPALPSASTIGHSGLQPPKRRFSPDRSTPVKIFAPGRSAKSRMDRELDQEVAREKERRLKAIQMGQVPGRPKSAAAAAAAASPPAAATSPPGRVTSPGPADLEKARSPERSVTATASSPANTKKRKLESVFMSTKKRRV